MANLASIIMEGATFGSGISTKLSHSYDHENGATLIAMESAEALRDIFETTFYVPNTCEIAAALEGASCVEESSQAAIMEGAFKNAFAKIKDFFIKLKEKVIALLHSIMRYLDGIFKSDQDWVKKYKEDLKNLKSSDLKDYEVKMYKYTNLDHYTGIQADMNNVLDELMAEIDNYINEHNSDKDEVDSDVFEENAKKKYEDFVKENFGADADDDDEIEKSIFGMFRDGAADENDKEEISVASNKDSWVTALEKSGKELTTYNKEIADVKKGYENIVKYINKLEDKVSKLNITDEKAGKLNYKRAVGKVDRYANGNAAGVRYEREETSRDISTTQAQSNITSYLRTLSSAASTEQSLANRVYTAKKTAYVERNGAYKKALMGAFAYARKNKKK